MGLLDCKDTFGSTLIVHCNTTPITLHKEPYEECESMDHLMQSQPDAIFAYDLPRNCSSAMAVYVESVDRIQLMESKKKRESKPNWVNARPPRGHNNTLSVWPPTRYPAKQCPNSWISTVSHNETLNKMTNNTYHTALPLSCRIIGSHTKNATVDESPTNWTKREW